MKTIESIIKDLECYAKKADLRDYRIHAQDLADYIIRTTPTEEIEQYLINGGDPEQHIFYKVAIINDKLDEYNKLVEDTLRPYKKKQYVSIGNGDMNEYLIDKYNIEDKELYMDGICGFVSGQMGTSPRIEYFVSMEYFIKNLSKFVTILERDGFPFVSIGKGGENGKSVVEKYGIDYSLVWSYNVFDHCMEENPHWQIDFTNNWLGCCRQSTYYVTMKTYLDNLGKFRKVIER